MKTKSKTKETRSVKTYFGPAPLKSGYLSKSYILENLASGQIFERKDRTKIVIEISGERVSATTLSFDGNPIDEHRVFTKSLFADLLIAKHFEPTTVARRETYFELADRKLYNNFR